MPTEREMRAMNEQQAMAAIPRMSLSELREAQSWPLNADILRAIQAEVHRLATEDAQTKSERRGTWRFTIATLIALAALVVAVAMWVATR